MECRITLRMLAYWEKLRGDRLMPTVSEFKSEDIQDRWGSCFLLPLVDGKLPDHYNTYIGKDILNAYNQGLSEYDDNRLISADISTFILNHRKVIQECKPLLEEGEFRNILLGTIKYRQCLLPLGQDGKVEAIVGGMHFKNFLPEPKNYKVAASAT
jgi:hypothetical protein